MTTSYLSRLGTAPEEAVKAPCVVAATSNITLSGEQTINGVAVVAGDRVLVAGQTDASENGIYDVATSAWSRSSDWNDKQDIVNYTLVIVPNAVYAAHFSGTLSVGTTSVTFTSISSLPSNTSDYELGTDAAATSHPGIITGHTITTNYRDSNRVAGSGSKARFTGTTVAAKAGHWFGDEDDGFGYDADGKQFENVSYVLRPEQWGAHGDDSNGDTANVNAALQSAERLHLTDDAVYLVTGVHSGKTNQHLVGTGTLKLAVLSANDGSPIFDVQHNGLIIDGPVFDGQASSQPADGFSDSFNTGGNGTGRAYRAGIVADKSAHLAVDSLTVKNCTFKNTYGAGLATRNVDDIRFSDNTGDATYFELAYIGCETGTIANVECHDNVVLNAGSGNATVNANGFTVQYARRAVFAENIFYNIERNFIKFENCEDISCSENVGHGTTVDNFGGLQMQGVSKNVVIDGNVLVSCGAGIDINTSSVQNLTITNNIVDTTTGSSTPDGISFVYDVDSLIIHGNQLIDIQRHAINYGGGQTKDIPTMSIMNNVMVGQKLAGGTVTNYAFNGKVDATYNINDLIFSGNQARGFCDVNGSGWFNLNRSTGSGVVSRILVNGNLFSGGGTSRVFRVTVSGLIADGVISGNIFDGDVYIHTACGCLFVQNECTSLVAPVAGYANPLRLGGSSLWIAASGEFRIATGTPSSDTDGYPLSTLITANTNQLSSASNQINTWDLKVAGLMVFNTATNKPVWAVGNAATSVWVDATGTTAHTPT